jgi:hypothetical protein
LHHGESQKPKGEPKVHDVWATCFAASSGSKFINVCRYGKRQGWAFETDTCLHKVWGIRNAYKHGTPVDVFESASERRGADGIDARALMATYMYIYTRCSRLHMQVAHVRQQACTSYPAANALLVDRCIRKIE